jgi:DNA-binding response OmpR family regulator
VVKDSELVQSGESTGARARCQRNASKRILVVDDDADIRRMNAQVLSRFGYQTETAKDGAEAWDALQANGYDLLITDNKMPRVSGIELVKKVRSEGMALPVILASGAMPEEVLNRALWLRLAATLVKPFTGDQLLGTVKKVLRETDFAGEQSEPMPIWRSQPSTDALRL